MIPPTCSRSIRASRWLDLSQRSSPRAAILSRSRTPAHNPANEVRYFNGGRWPDYAAGGGSSLELRDPRADNTIAEAWGASDESNKSSWQTYIWRGFSKPGQGGEPTLWHEFALCLIDGAGEALLDDNQCRRSARHDAQATHFERQFQRRQAPSTGVFWARIGTAGRSRSRVIRATSCFISSPPATANTKVIRSRRRWPTTPLSWTAGSMRFPSAQNGWPASASSTRGFTSTAWRTRCN